MRVMLRGFVNAAVLTVCGLLVSCEKPTTAPETEIPTVKTVVVSNPVGLADIAAIAFGSTSAEQVVYVSLASGSVIGGRTAFVTRVGGSDSVGVQIIDGGFDPVAIAASGADTIVVVVRNSVGATLLEARTAVALKRPPVVVRTSPPRKKSDVPVNMSIVIVFNEPVLPATINESTVRVMRGTTSVPGSVRVLEGNGSVVAFTPSSPLAPNAEHRVVVSETVADLDGDVLGSETVIEFTTGQSSLGRAASISISPDVVVMTGRVYQLAATVRDALGNDLTDVGVAWSVSGSSSSPPGIEVSSGGRVTALDVGSHSVTATVDGLADTTTVITNAGVPVSLTLSPEVASVPAGDTVILTATVRDFAGRALSCVPLKWATSDGAVGLVNPHGAPCTNDRAFYASVTGVVGGSIGVTVSADDGKLTGTSAVTVVPGRPVASVTLVAGFTSMVPQSRRKLNAVLRDTANREIFIRPVSWHSDTPAVAEVGADGILTAVGAGSTNVIVTSEGISDTATITVALVTFTSISVGIAHVCGLTTTGTAYCWGNNDDGQLGDGTRHDPNPRPGPLGIIEDPTRPFGHSPWPVPVATDVKFSSLSTGARHSCGLATTGTLYCWGSPVGEYFGERRLVPVPLDFETKFASIFSSGPYFFAHSADVMCGLTADGRAHCWGANRVAVFGDGTTPAPVAGGHRYTALSVGFWHACGITTGASTFCWGTNSNGQLGIGSIGDTPIKTPVAVSGGLSFSSVSVGEAHTCGVTTAGVTYCWGENSLKGVLGNGSHTDSSVPVRVSGTWSFASIVSGQEHTCGLTTSGAAYCWGQPSWAFGDGTSDRPSDSCDPIDSSNCSSVPFAVPGGLTFAKLSAGGYSTCGITTDGQTYCWGGGYAKSGSGSILSPAAPQKVAGQP
jgi:alpha-tubulin suppressor-like RCC1 family protein